MEAAALKAKRDRGDSLAYDARSHPPKISVPLPTAEPSNFGKQSKNSVKPFKLNLVVHTDAHPPWQTRPHC